MLVFFAQYGFCEAMISSSASFHLAPPSRMDIIADQSQKYNPAASNFYRKNISAGKEAEKLLNSRYDFLVNKVKLPDIIKNALRTIRNEERYELTDEEIDNCCIILFGDYLWHAEGDTPNDLDILILIENSNITINGFVFSDPSEKIPHIAVANVHGTNKFKNSLKGRSNLTLVMAGPGTQLSGSKQAVKDLLLPINEIDILQYSKSLFDNGRLNLSLGSDLGGDNRKVWKRYFDSYIYLLPLMEKYLSPQEITDFENDLFGMEFSSYFANFMTGKIADFPWQTPNIKIKLERFAEMLEKNITLVKSKIGYNPYREQTLELEADGGLIHYAERRFPDGEWSLKLVEPESINNRDVTLKTSINSSEDLVKTILMLDLLKLPVYKAKSVNIHLANISLFSNDLINLLRGFCDNILIAGNNETVNISAPADFQKKDIPIKKLNTILCHRKRLISDANDVARLIPDANLTCKTVSIIKKNPNPIEWIIDIPSGMKDDENVVLIHSCETNEDIAELWVMLSALRRQGIGSITLINTYEGYARQDKLPEHPEFIFGEGVSALTMLKVAGIYADYHMAFNVHYSEKSGLKTLDSHGIYNLNMFVQLAETHFEDVVHRVGMENIQDEIRMHPPLLIAPDKGAFAFIEEAAAQLEIYIQREYNITAKIEFGHLEKKRRDDRTVSISNYVIKKDGSKLHDISKYWIFVIDDETSSGSTLLNAVYVLTRNLNADWQRIYTGVVHGKFAGGFSAFETGLDRISLNTAKEPPNIDEQKGFMPTRNFPYTTRSAKLPKNYPQQQIISIRDMLYHALRHILQGVPSKSTQQLNHNQIRTVQNSN